jgi:hypothetical protein
MKFSVSWQQTKEKKTRKEGPERGEKKNKKLFHKKAYKDSRLIECTRKDSIRETKFDVASAFVSVVDLSSASFTRAR